VKASYRDRESWNDKRQKPQKSKNAQTDQVEEDAGEEVEEPEVPVFGARGDARES